ncbi:hypothetical protein Agub_g4856, partial [Astrephomene gubernaculifera]
LELMPEGGPGVCSGVHSVVEGYTEEPQAPGAAPLLRRLLYSPHSRTCLLAAWEQSDPAATHPHPQQAPFQLFQTHAPAETASSSAPLACRGLLSWSALTGTAASLLEDPDTAAVDAAFVAAAPAAADKAPGASAPSASAPSAGAGEDAAARWVVLSATYG